MRKNEVTIDLDEITNTCFVAMPFDSLHETRFDHLYEDVFQRAVERTGLASVRGDKINQHSAVMADVWRALRCARVILADLSFQRANVLYEVGLAHALGKPIVFVTSDPSDVPSLVGSLRYCHYKLDDPYWRRKSAWEIASKIQDVIDQNRINDHLPSIAAHVALPPPPERSALLQLGASPNIVGVWRAKWLSARHQLEHDATLVIREQHGIDFTATMTVECVLGGEPVVVEEVLRGDIEGQRVVLSADTFKFVRRGAAKDYELDRFDLVVAPDGRSLKGRRRCQHGARDITFQLDAARVL